jgi:cyclohexanecarboxyl-CoA dehydrogenase
VDFDLLPEHADLVAVAKRIAGQLKPGYVERDRRGEFPAEVLKILAGADLLGLNVPEAAGGQGAGFVALGLVTEQLAYGDIVASSLLLTASTMGNLLHQFGAADLAARWIPRLIAGEVTIALGLTEPQGGSDLRSVTTVARRDGGHWTLRGEKSSVSFSGSDAVVVLAATDEGPELFFLEDLDGAHFSALDDMGMRTGTRAIMILDDVRVADGNRLRAPSGFKAILRSLEAARLLVGMNAIGIGQAALDEAVSWSQERVTWGKPLSNRQAVAFSLVEHWTELEMGRLLAMRGLWLADQGRPHGTEAAMAKAWIPPRVTKICHDALLLAGHVGYSREHPAQLRLRDAIGLEIGEGPTSIQQILLSRQLLGVTPG